MNSLPLGSPTSFNRSSTGSPVPFNFYFGLRLLAFLSFSRLVLLDALLRHVALPALGDWCPEFFLKRIPPDFFCQGKKREGRARRNYGQEFW
jgi:hypothetical protein